MAQKLSLEQAQSLVEQGFMTKKGFQTMIENGELAVFRFRSQANKPEAVQRVHDAIIAVIEPEAYNLLEAGFRPSIVWNSIGPKDEAEGDE